MWNQTSLVQERATLPTAAFVTAGEMVALFIVYMALTSVRHVHSRRKDGSGFRMLVHRESHSCELRCGQMRLCTTLSIRILYKIKLPQRVLASLTS